MNPEEFEAKCAELCPYCAAGEMVRQRLDTLEFVHDFTFASKDPRVKSIGHGICLAHDFRMKNG